MLFQVIEMFTQCKRKMVFVNGVNKQTADVTIIQYRTFQKYIMRFIIVQNVLFQASLLLLHVFHLFKPTAFWFVLDESDM